MEQRTSPPTSPLLSATESLFFKKDWKVTGPKDVEEAFASMGLVPARSGEKLDGGETRETWRADVPEIRGEASVILRGKKDGTAWGFESASLRMPWSKEVWETPETTLVPLFPERPLSGESFEGAKVWKLPGGRTVWVQREGEGEGARMRIGMEAAEE